MDKKYKYQAFISYRHNEIDKYVAENLHRLLETYKMPKVVSKRLNLATDEKRRVFRDQEELPLASNLETPIIEALKESNFLIVICSPRLKESIWCKREIENFIKFHGRKKILCVLVEGEPKDSFPEELLYEEKVTITKTGKEKIEKIPCEPLAADVRGTSKKEIYRKIKSELIRIIAPMYGIDYDDLKRRHEERETKRKIRTASIVALASIFFALYSSLMLVKIYRDERKLRNNQAITLANESIRALENDDRRLAIEKGYASLTKDKGIKMPKTTLGQYALTESLGLYYTDNYYYPVTTFDTLGIVDSIKTDQSLNYLLSYDNSYTLTLWDLKKEKAITKINDIGKVSFNKYKYTFIGDQYYAYQNNDKELIVNDFKGKNIYKVKYDDYLKGITASQDGKYLAINLTKKLILLDTSDFKELTTVTSPKDKSINKEMFFDEAGKNLIYAVGESLTMEPTDIELNTLNMEKLEVVNKSNFKMSYLMNMKFVDNNCIFVANLSKGIEYTMEIISYNYLNGNVNYENKYHGEWGITLARSFKENTNSLLVASYGTAYIFDLSSGKELYRLSIGDQVINLYSMTSGNVFMLMTKNGDVHYINGGTGDDIIYEYLYNFSLNDYTNFVITNEGILATVNKQNRIIKYNKLTNKDIAEIEYKDVDLKKLEYKETEQIKKDYQFKKVNLITYIALSSDKKTLFVSYTDKTLEIYNHKTKKLLNTIENVNGVDTYVGKTKKGYHLVKGMFGGYIINDDYELIAFVPSLYDYNKKKDLLIIKVNKKYYQVKIYDIKDILKKVEK